MKRNPFWTKLLLSISAAVLLTFSAFSAEVRNITFKQEGDYELSPDILKNNMQLKKGSKFDLKTLDDDIKRIQRTGYFSSIDGRHVKNDDGTVDIIITVTPNPRVKEIVIEGNKKFDNKKLEPLIKLKTNEPLKDQDLKESTDALREFYRKEGYNDATITPEAVDIGKGFIKVTFHIQENLRLKVGSVNFEGNTVFYSWKLRGSIATQHSFFSRWFDIGLLNREELENDKLRLRELYWEKGYLDFKVSDIKLKEEEGNPEYIDVTFVIEEGTPYKVGSVSIVGSERFSQAELMELLEIKPGDTYDSRTERKDIKAISGRYYALGYVDFICNAEKLPDYKTHTVDIQYRIVEGRPYTVNKVNISGNQKTKDYVIRRELYIQPEEPVDPAKIERSKSRLMELGYFDDVKAVTVNANQVGMKNVDFNVKEAQTAHFKIGGGFSDVDSLFGMISAGQSNFDLFAPDKWFVGGGQKLSARGMFGLERYDFDVNFTEPWLFDVPLALDLSGYLNNVDYEYWSEQRFGGTVGLSYPLLDEYRNRVRAGLEYKLEHVKVYDMEDELKYIIGDEEDSERVGSLAFNLGWDTRDSASDPTEGHFINALGSLSSKAFGGSGNYWRSEVSSSYHYSILDKAIIFHARAKVGSVENVGGTKRVPLYERYFLGGSDSLRGFPYRGVSPVDPINEHAIGGKGMYHASLEMTHPIWEFIRGAIFVDAGNVTSGAGFHKLNELNVGAGYGLRIKLPKVDTPIKLDLAYPIRNRQKGVKNKLRFHFSMGFAW